MKAMRGLIFKTVIGLGLAVSRPALATDALGAPAQAATAGAAPVDEPTTSVASVPPPSDAAVTELKAAIVRDVTDQVRGGLAEYFVHAGLDMPTIASTSVEPTVETGVATVAIKTLRVEVKLVTDLPPNIVREARLHLMRDFESKGQPVELIVAAEVGEAPKKAWTEQGHAFLTLIALVLGALSLMALAGAMIVRAWRRRHVVEEPKRPKRAPAVTEQTRYEPGLGLEGLPTLASPSVSELSPPPPVGATLAAPPPPPLAAGPLISVNPERVKEMTRTQQDVPFRAETARASQETRPRPQPSPVRAGASALPAERLRELAAMPLDRALHELSSMTEPERDAAMESLQLNPSLRRRLAKDLSVQD